MLDDQSKRALVAFALIYLTFFLDNVLLTVLVPIIPDWIRGESLELWARHETPLGALLNSTVHRIIGEERAGVGGSQAAVGLVLGAKAGVQLCVAPLAAAAVARRGSTAVLRQATALLAAAAAALWWCSAWRGWRAGLCAGVCRALQGAGAALAGVGGLALCAAAVPRERRDRALGALLGAVALGVLVGYPFGGATYALWSRGAPFLLIAAALLADLAMQYMFLENDDINHPCASPDESSRAAWRWSGACGGACGGAWGGAAERACAGAVLLTTAVVATLEPCLPLWIEEKFHPQRWVLGAVFVPDSAAYLVAAQAAAGAARGARGTRAVAALGQVAVALAALAVPHATSVWGLVAPHVVLGAGLGAADGALVPALVGRAPHRAHRAAALLQAAASAAYALGPVVGALVAWAGGLGAALRGLAVLNLLHAAVLYRALAAHPLGQEEDGEEAGCGEEGAELTPLQPHAYAPLR